MGNFRQNYLAPGQTTNAASPSHSACRHADFVECSDAGVCDRSSGTCDCFEGYEGAACQRATCLNDCSGHGQCQSNIEFSIDGSYKRATTGSSAAEGYWTNQEDASQVDPRKNYIGAWDSGIHFGCKCDVGFRGDDCSLIECPSTTDPLGWYGNDDGEDCSGVASTTTARASARASPATPASTAAPSRPSHEPLLLLAAAAFQHACSRCPRDRRAACLSLTRNISSK